MHISKQKKKSNKTPKSKYIPYQFFLILLQWKALPAYKGKNKDVNLTKKKKDSILRITVH